MVYMKNVPAWERAVRVLFGIGLIAASVTYFGYTTIGWVVGVAGAMADGEPWGADCSRAKRRRFGTQRAINRVPIRCSPLCHAPLCDQ